MKRIILFLLVLLILSLAACGVSNSSSEEASSRNSTLVPPELQATIEHLTFEDAVLEFATDVVIAQYVGHRPFGDNLTEFEFVVLERILGNAADRIFVYVQHTFANIVYYQAGDLTFYPEREYLLPLIGINSPYAKTHEDGFLFISNTVVDLSVPSDSVMRNDPLSEHAEGLDFDGRDVSEEQIVSYVDELTTGIPPAWTPIRSEVMEDIIHGSPYVLLIEINEPFRLADEQLFTDIWITDIYYATAVQVLKGDIRVEDFGDEFAVIFFPDTVFPGEQHIVALSPRVGESMWFEFSSRNSLFRMDQLDEILVILGRQ